MGCIEWCARTCQSFFSLAESSTRMVEEWSRNPAVRVRRRWTLMVLAKAKERDALCADVPATQRKTTPTDKNSPAKSEGECRHCGKKGHKWADCRKRLAEAKDKKVHGVDGTPTTATATAVEDTEEIDEAGNCGDWSDDEDNRVDTSEARVEGNNKPVDAEFFPLDSACEEHTCPWNFAEGGPSNVQLRNASGLSIP